MLLSSVTKEHWTLNSWSSKDAITKISWVLLLSSSVKSSRKKSVFICWTYWPVLLKEKSKESPSQFVTFHTILAGENIRCKGGASHLKLRIVPAGAWQGTESEIVGLPIPINNSEIYYILRREHLAFYDCYFIISELLNNVCIVQKLISKADII